jgi:hypothetical protein
MEQDSARTLRPYHQLLAVQYFSAMRFLAGVLTFVALTAFRIGAMHEEWTPSECAAIQSLSLASAGPPPADPSNKFADDPRARRARGVGTNAGCAAG